MRHLEELAVVALSLAALPAAALHFLLRVHAALLDGADGAQVTPHHQHRAALAQPYGGP